jgi:hypothetical protein
VAHSLGLGLLGKFLCNAFENKQDLGRHITLREIGVGPKQVWHFFFVEIGYIRCRNGSLIFGEFSEK